jgi:tetratricopeptide (TPR) repeat protein
MSELGNPTIQPPPILLSIEEHFRKANEFHSAGKLPEAVEELRRALKIMPECPEAHYNLANVVRDAGEIELAIEGYKAAINFAKAKRHHYPDAQINLGDLLTRIGRYDQAIDSFEEAIRIQPNRPQPHIGIGLAQEGKGRLYAAIKTLEHAATLAPTDAALATHIATLLYWSGHFDESLAKYDAALAIDPAFPEAHFERGKALLLQGRIAEGFAEYEWRWKTRNFQNRRRPLEAPEWDGAAPLDGKTVLVYGEQGYGDVLQFIRYAKYLADRGAKVIVVADEGLKRLFRTVPGIGEVFGHTARLLPAHDYVVAVMSLPHLFGTTETNIPAEIPYIAADPVIAEAWGKKLSGIEGMRVGVVWAGRPEYTKDKPRSIEVQHLAPLAKVPGVKLVSLQIGRPGEANQLDMLWPGNLPDFAETAGLVANLDLVITVDTAAAHLAGAMGKPVWLMLPTTPDWRWQLNREDSPWYPSLRIFRQRRPKDWAGVIAEVATALAERARKA